jgi:hypothetical protein
MHCAIVQPPLLPLGEMHHIVYLRDCSKVVDLPNKPNRSRVQYALRSSSGNVALAAPVSTELKSGRKAPAAESRS